VAGTLKALNKERGGGAEVEPLPVSLEQLLSKSKFGVWWSEPSRINHEDPLAAAAERKAERELEEATGRSAGGGGYESDDDGTVGGGGGGNLLALARKHRMNTATRRAVFCAVMGAVDFVDAKNKLVGLRLKVFTQGSLLRDVNSLRDLCC